MFTLLRIAIPSFCMDMNGANPFICFSDIGAAPLTKWTSSPFTFSVEIVMIFMISL